MTTRLIKEGWPGFTLALTVMVFVYWQYHYIPPSTVESFKDIIWNGEVGDVATVEENTWVTQISVKDADDGDVYRDHAGDLGYRTCSIARSSALEKIHKANNHREDLYRYYGPSGGARCDHRSVLILRDLQAAYSETTIEAATEDSKPLASILWKVE